MTIWCTPAGSVKIISLSHRTDKPCVPGLFFHAILASTSLEVLGVVRRRYAKNNYHILESRIRCALFIFHTMLERIPSTAFFNLYSTNHHQFVCLNLSPQRMEWNCHPCGPVGKNLFLLKKRRHKARLQAIFILVWTLHLVWWWCECG